MTLVGVVGLITLDYKILAWLSSSRAALASADSDEGRARARVKEAEQQLIDTDKRAKGAEQRLSFLLASSSTGAHAGHASLLEAEKEARRTMEEAAAAAEALVRARKGAHESSDTRAYDDAHQRAASRHNHENLYVHDAPMKVYIHMIVNTPADRYAG